MRKLFSFVLLTMLMTSVTAFGGAQNDQGTLHLRGKVLDSTELPMAAAAIRIYEGSAAPKEGTAAFKESQSDAVGNFDIEMPAGEYYLEVAAPDFNTFGQAVRVAPNMEPLAVTLTVESVETEVDVNAEQNEVGVDPESSLTTDVITGDALLDLPDNEEDLLTYLQELAAARGIVDDQLSIRVDGFENSYLPNRMEIAEIRIINNSFSAESNASGPRIEIVTRPGSGFWTGNLGFGFADESLNAAAPLTGRKPASQTRNFDGQLRGPIIPGRITMSLNVRNRESDSEGSAIRAVGINGPVDQGITSLNKQRNFRFGPNITINDTNTLIANFNYSDSRNDNSGVGGFNLPERASNRRGHNWTLQMTERATLSNRSLNEFRVQMRQNNSDTIPTTSARAVNVQDAFNGGGATNRSQSRSQDFMIADQVRWQPSRSVQLTWAVQADYHKSHSDSENNYLGTYTFASLEDYCYAENFPGTNCQVTQDIVEAALAAGETPTFTNAAGNVIPITGVPTQFSITTGNPIFDVQQAEYSAYIQGEWRLAPRAQISFGARYQVQQHLKDYNNIAPTGGISYQLSTKQNWQTVIRAGGRMTYQTYGMNNWEQLLRNSGTSDQYSIVVLNPAYPTPNLDLGTVSSTGGNSLRIRAEDYVAPYTIQPSFSIDQNLPKGNRVSFNFQINRGVHQSRTRNINAPYPGTPLPDSVLELLNSHIAAEREEGRAIVDQLRPLYPNDLANIYQQESRGTSLSKMFSVQYRINNKSILWNKMLIGGYVTWRMTWAQDDNGTPMNPYDLAAEWGRSTQDQRHRVTASLNIQIPGNMRFSFNQLGWNSGRPYTLTLGSDLNGDNSNNDRPAGIGRNTETGPSYFNPIRFTFTKTFTLQSNRVTTIPADNYMEPQRGGGGFGGGGGGGFGGGRGGGFGGRGRRDSREIRFSVSVNNLFNSTIRQNISGVMSSPLFGQPTGGGRGRTIELNLSTNLGQLF